ncbi:hypothetical protein A2U01_0052818, partial [Trifolium medium]|nr:hypothetical protein [Trifolium medium]
EERVRDKRVKEIAKPFAVVAAATGFSGKSDVDLKFENPSRKREKSGGGRSFFSEGEWRRCRRGVERAER